MVPQFVKQLGMGEVEMVAERGGEELVYIAELYLAPDYLCIPVKPMLVWFFQLLCGPVAGFNALTEATYDLDT